MTLWQADPRWSTLMLGHGPARIGRAGCLLTILTEAARILAGRHGLLPPHANEQLRQTPGAFVAAGTDIRGDSLVVEVAARALGMESPQSERVDGDNEALREAIEAALLRGLAILHVNHDDDISGDHFILANGRGEGGTVEALDPALARTVVLSWPELTADVHWNKKPKHYTVVAVRPIRTVAS